VFRIISEDNVLQEVILEFFNDTSATACVKFWQDM